jgi:hypothetical protein
MRPGLNSGGLECWLTLNFKRAPKTGDSRDVRVRFSSVVLFEDEEFDWDYLASHDMKSIDFKDWLGNAQTRFEPVAETTPESDPPIGGSMMVKFQIRSQAEVKLKPGDETALKATLLWAGTEQDSMRRGLFLAYQTK